MKVGSLFSGIGGMDLGLERAGFSIVWQCESDDFCRSILSRHFPDTQCFQDVRSVTHERAGSVDLVCGGFPCQDISVAGNGDGLSGQRSGLWFEMLRIVRELRPDWVLVENVPRLRTLGSDVVLEGLEALDYSCWPLVVGADDAGALHERKRAWIVGALRLRKLVVPDSHDARVRVPVSGGEFVANRPVSISVSDAGSSRREEQRRTSAEDEEQRIAVLGSRWPDRAAVRRGVDGFSGWMDGASEPDGGSLLMRVARLRALGNACVPQVVELIGRAILQAAVIRGAA